MHLPPPGPVLPSGMVPPLEADGCSPLAAPFAIGGVRVPNRVVLAPMAGLTGTAYRRHLKAHGAGLVMTEMVSSYGLTYRNVRTWGYLEFADEERPSAVQLFGDEPEVMERAAEIVLSRERTPDMLDINMGCPVRKVVKTGAGCALMGDRERALAVAGAVVKAAGAMGGGAVPVTVKLRSGLAPGDGLALDLAPRLEQAGVAGLGLHPRAAGEYYHGRADHSVTAAVVSAVGIPVIASGDIDSVESALSIVETTGAAAVMVARGAAGNPWLVGELLSGRRAARPPLPVVVADLRLLHARAEEEMGSDRAVRWIRKLLTWYLRPSGVPAHLITPLCEAADVAGLDVALAGLPQQPELLFL